MDQGLWVAVSGGILQTRELEVTANNLANVNTVGFKAQRLVSRQQEFADTLASTIANAPIRASGDQDRVPGVVDIQTVTDFTPGPVSHTGNPLHVALREPDTFFVVDTPDGEQYTRAGNFTLDVQGNVVTPDGFPVLGEGGPLTVPPGGQVRISSSGQVTTSPIEAGAEVNLVGTVRTVRIEDTTQLQRVGSTRFQLVGEGGGANQVEAKVVPQSVEMPNVNVVESMVGMINAQRSFEAYTKSVQTIDQLNDLALRTSRSA